MGEYRKRYDSVQAVQWNGANIDELAVFGQGAVRVNLDSASGIHLPTVKTSDYGHESITPGDYVIKGGAGTFFVCDAATFEARYIGVERPPDKGLYQAGASWQDIAASAYRAYAASTGNKNYLGLPMPAFDALPVPIQTAWEAAVRQTVENYTSHGIVEYMEQSWNGWVSPFHVGNE